MDFGAGLGELPRTPTFYVSWGMTYSPVPMGQGWPGRLRCQAPALHDSSTALPGRAVREARTPLRAGPNGAQPTRFGERSHGPSPTPCYSGRVHEKGKPVARRGRKAAGLSGMGGGRAAERSLMEPPERSSASPAIGVLAASLAMRLTPEELEWLWRELKDRSEGRRPGAAAGQRAIFDARGARLRRRRHAAPSKRHRTAEAKAPISSS